MARKLRKPARPASPKSAKPHTDADVLPSKQDILCYIQSSQTKVGKREIARAFGIKGATRIAFKQLLAEMAEEGLLAGGRKHLRKRGAVPSVTVIEIYARDTEGDLLARPVNWDEDGGEMPVIRIRPRRKSDAELGALGIGDRVLARVSECDSQAEEVDPDEAASHVAEPIKKLSREARQLIGVFRAHEGGGTIEPVDRKMLRSWPVRAEGVGEARDGDLVRFDIARKSGRFGVPEARITERLGNPQDQRLVSLIAVHAHGLPDAFPQRALDELDDLPKLSKEGRADLTGLPLITIDPVDARDHDDAVHAEADTDPENEGGYVVTVAIADVAHYVRAGSRLDREAEKRGNSIYFPDRVVPMLPELISNDLCSLRENEIRPCLAVRMVFDRSGIKRSHAFVRALMRSHAKLSYQEAQAAFDGNPGDKAGVIAESVLAPLWSAYRALAKARDKRGPLDLDLPERKILLDEKGQIAAIITPERLEAHRLIEEFMIQANVAAAETLEAHRTACVYRVHEEPSKEKLAALRPFLESLELSLPSSSTMKPHHFNSVLAQAKDMPVGDLVNEVILRAQSQAEYNVANVGHFGLNLRRYAHFTSPIRRYADLLVHRALVRALKLGEGGLPEEQEARLGDISQSISQAERRAMAAERETTDRLVALYLADRIGAEFDARISGVTRSGLFVRLRETGADGFVAIATLGDAYFHYDESHHRLVAERTSETFQLGDNVRVRLVEAIPTAGALRFEMLSRGKKSARALPKGVRGQRRQRGRFGRR